ncbi:type II toxin-antitoxin system HipA family toxin [Maritalea porphyrae]|uniref:type II toxin-antitoxin system HipA family toxin n=1 Tax=Maritalea porphyrae TaxID=880732 RepID=UPI0022AFB124|nr:type II toxin-antitoxin system HipA family toxin [Maritalea porphyrae]MCZ4273366.1 type II toxin-antitoxin system HipA family toxin [Maritalea porphyrae]
MTTASVELWGKQIGAVTWDASRGIGVFQYTPEFEASRIEVSPIRMPWREAPYEFQSLSRDTFKGLPGMLADSLPDKFGNALINVWLSSQGRNEGSFNPVERLCYTGTRGMGALEYKPATIGTPTKARTVEIHRLVDLSNRILNERENLAGTLSGGEDDARYIEDILRVGTSAGGARAKAILAWNETTGEFQSGQVQPGKDFSHWLIKFDGVDKNSDKELTDPQGFGRIEYAYYLMAKAADITMMPSRLHEEGGRAHFMTKRFDRTERGEKLHYQSLGALMHYDFNVAGAHSYEQAVQTIKTLKLPAIDREQQVRRALFNIIARNQDDHVKNIGFVMDKEGEWRLSPAFDVAYSYNPYGDWTSKHQMSLNGKRDNFDMNDLVAFAQSAGIKARTTKGIVAEIVEVVASWSEYADEAGVLDEHVDQIKRAVRVSAFS